MTDHEGEREPGDSTVAEVTQEVVVGPHSFGVEIAAGQQAPLPGGAVSLDQMAAGSMWLSADGEVNYPPRVRRAVRRLPSLDSKTIP